MEHLLAKYIAGEASEEEQIIFKKWLDSDPKHLLEYNQYKEIWEKSKSNKNIPNKNVDIAWLQFQRKLDASKEQSNVVSIKKRNWHIAYAAAAILLICLGIFWFSNSGNVIYENHLDSKTIALKDNSTIILNKNARITTTKKFNKADRNVQLEGEAFFDIAKNKNLPFVVKVDNVFVSVVGTSFNVKSTNEIVEVVVESGVVNVAYNQKVFTLKANDYLQINKHNKVIHQSNIENELYKYYRTNTFICNNTPIINLIESLESAYMVKIKIGNESLKLDKITGTFKRSDDIAQILETIALTMNATFKFDGKQYIIH